MLRESAHPLTRMCVCCLSKGASAAAHNAYAHAPLPLRSKCTPPSPFAQHVIASCNHSGMRSRGYRPPLDITLDYAQASCLYGAACGVLPHEIPRSRNQHYVQVAAALPCAAKVPRSRRGVVSAPARCASARLPALLEGAAARRWLQLPARAHARLGNCSLRCPRPPFPTRPYLRPSMVSYRGRPCPRVPSSIPITGR